MEVLGGEVVLEVDGFVVVLEAEFTCSSSSSSSSSILFHKQQWSYNIT